MPSYARNSGFIELVHLAPETREANALLEAVVVSRGRCVVSEFLQIEWTKLVPLVLYYTAGVDRL